MNDALIGRVYRTGFWYRMSYLSYALLGSFALTVPATRRDWGDGRGHLLVLALGAGMIVFGILFTINAFALRLSFSNSGIEYSSIFGQVYYPYETIRGRHEYTEEWSRGRPHHYQLWPIDGSEPIDFKKGAFRFDDAFWNWFYALPDMDAKESTSDVVTT